MPARRPAYGTLRAFVRLQFASRTGATGGLRSGTQERIGNAFGATGQDQSGRVQQFVNTDKAFIQFAGLTAGRASSFFDFYAHDFEFAGATANSDLQSTNLLAYTSKLGDSGLSATISLEDPSFRRNTIYSQEFARNFGSGAFAGSERRSGRAPNAARHLRPSLRQRRCLAAQPHARLRRRAALRRRLGLRCSSPLPSRS